jgi:hypothetical protein
LGCAKTQPINLKQLPNIEKVGVISVLGNTVEYQYLGTTVFNQVQKPIDLGFDIDKLMKSEIEKKLTKHSELNIVDIQYDFAKLSSINEAKTYHDLSLIKNELYEIGQTYSLDAILLIRKGRGRVGNAALGNYDEYGFGIFKRNFIAYDDTFAHMFAFGLLIDAKTIEPINHFSIKKYQQLEPQFSPSDDHHFSEKQIKFISNWFITELKQAIETELLKTE